jgi:tryptophanase
MFGKTDKNGKTVPAAMELVRMAIPRRVYTKSHIDYIAEACIETYGNKNSLKGMRITHEAEYLRHFTVKLEYI